MKTKKHILLAEDDANLGMMLKIFLEMNDFNITLCENGETALKMLESQSFDLAILDIMMPLLDGFSVAVEIQKKYKQMPFVFLTAKALKDDQIKGYQLGASDYLIKPFDPEILLFKIQVLLQKNSLQTNNSTIFNIGNYEFNPEKRYLKIDTHEQKLSPKEAELLQLLCEKKGEVLSHEEALLKVWKNDDYFTKQSMNVFITHLRKFLSFDTMHHIEIENLHSKGFILKVEQI